MRLADRPNVSIAKRPVRLDERAELPVTGVSDFVRALARKYNIGFQRTGLDTWAEAASRAAGDEVRLDETGNLLVVLKKRNLIDGRQMARLLSNHLREKKRVRSV